MKWHVVLIPYYIWWKFFLSSPWTFQVYEFLISACTNHIFMLFQCDMVWVNSPSLIFVPALLIGNYDKLINTYMCVITIFYALYNSRRGSFLFNFLGPLTERFIIVFYRILECNLISTYYERSLNFDLL